MLNGPKWQPGLPAFKESDAKNGRARGIREGKLDYHLTSSRKVLKELLGTTKEGEHRRQRHVDAFGCGRIDERP